MTSKLSKLFGTTLAVLIAFGFCLAPAAALGMQDDKAHEQAVEKIEAENTLWKPLVALGAGLVTLGGALGIGKLAASAMEGTARQPNAGGDIRTTMIIAAALIEGFTFFALIVCIIAT